MHHWTCSALLRYKISDFFRSLLVFKFATGKASAEDLKALQTVKPQESSTGAIDVNATLKEIRQTVERIAKVEQRISSLETKTEQLDPVHRPISTATAAVEVIIETSEPPRGTSICCGSNYLMFLKGNQPLMLVSSQGSSSGQHGIGQVQYRGEFTLDATSEIVGKPMTDLKSADHLQIVFDGMKPKQRVVGGNAVVTLNSAVTLPFVIPAQDMTSNFITVPNIAAILEKLQ